MLLEIQRQLSSQRAACKLFSTFIAVAILLAGAFGRLDTPSLLWVSAPIVVLGLAEAGYAAMERTYLEQAKRGTTDDLPDGQQLPPTSVGLGGFLSALGTFSVWPFYLLLWGIFCRQCHQSAAASS
jgi:ABC-type transport system involved in cytochrome c biogenesis permease component